MSVHTRQLVPRQPAYVTEFGAAYCGDSVELIAELPDESLNLVMTSPPFALQRKKAYGNEDQEAYVDWLLDFGRLVMPKLRPDGSLVVDLGGAYQKGTPARSLHNFRVLLRLCDEVGYFLAQDFYWFNPSRLPSPIEWVNKRKLRVKDSVNTVWWLSRSEWPKADVTRVLTPYSPRMQKLLQAPSEFYKPKLRPSGHDISEGFGRDNGGAIPSSLLQISNSESNGTYLAACKTLDIVSHPARFPAKLPEFFIRFLTEPGDVVLDIFAGSNTTGMVAETEQRRWLGFEQSLEYVAASVLRFLPNGTASEKLRKIYDRILEGAEVDLSEFREQTLLSF
jgi:site-specific DNA-methyltransferase (cytosine-N4-specific)